MCIVFKSVYIHFFLFVHDSFLCCIRKYGEERPICACVKTWHGSRTVLLATDYNSTVLHFDSLRQKKKKKKKMFVSGFIQNIRLGR